MTVADAITAVSVAIAALAFVSGINAWKREFIGKRRIQLAETVLALFYEAQDAIHQIRSPFSFAGEGSTRKRSDHETPEQSEVLDKAYVVVERYQKREKLFAKLRSMKYRVMATFGSHAREPFDELYKVLNEIFASAHILGTYYWRYSRSGVLSEKDLEEMRRHEAVFWFMGEDKDEISPRVQRAVEKIEAIAKEASMIKVSWFGKVYHKLRNRT